MGSVRQHTCQPAAYIHARAAGLEVIFRCAEAITDTLTGY
jgi:hypothetical protein